MYSTSKNNLAPIALFVYKRPIHLEKTIEALKRNYLADKSIIFIFSDGPKDDSDYQSIHDVRKIINSANGFKEKYIIEREFNLGLSNSIISGVTQILDSFNKIIVLEDDLVTSPYFLKYMNDALNFYENNQEVISIHGYIYPVKYNLPETFFLRGADCWGWGTWSRAWKYFQPDARKLLNELTQKDLLSEFDLNGALNNVRMLRNFIKGKNDSWAIRWHASAFLNNKLTLYPGKSLVKNFGADGLGTNVNKTKIYDVILYQHQIEVKPIPILENILVKSYLREYFLENYSPIKKILKKIFH